MDPISHNIYGRIGSHSIIRPACREGRGDDGAFEEAVSRARAIYESALEGWRKSGIEPTFHLVCGVEIPDGVPPPTEPAAEVQPKLDAVFRIKRAQDAEITNLAGHCVRAITHRILEVRGGPDAGGFLATLRSGALLVAHAIVYWPPSSEARQAIVELVDEEIKRAMVDIEAKEEEMRRLAEGGNHAD